MGDREQPIYGGFAAVYDLFMDNVPYGEWAEHIIEVLQQSGTGKGLVLDLGCGTGTITGLLADAGYDMIGVDGSAQMLELAREKQGERDILYLCQDIREFELYGTVGAAVSVCDTMNYLTEWEDLVKTLRLVDNYLDPGGIFLFDCNMPCYYERIGDDTIAEDREEASFIWENAYDPAEGINEFSLSFFVRESGTGVDALYRKYEETHRQRAYTLEELKVAVAQGGLSWGGAWDAATKGPVTAESERIYVLCRECKKCVEKQ